MATFADNLKAARKDRGMTQETLALAAALKQSAISRYETGEDLPEVPTLLKLATALTVPIETLVLGLDERFDIASLMWRRTPAAHAHGEVLANVVAVDEPQEANMETPRQAIERIVADLTAVARRLPRGSDAMADRRGPGDSPRPRRSRKQPHKARRPKPTPRR